MDGPSNPSTASKPAHGRSIAATTMVAASLLAGWPAAVGAQGLPALHPNAERYRVASPPATGRAGTAQLTARAMLRRDGTTDFDLTTGALDSAAAAPGQIAKVQLKLVDGSTDTVLWTRNFVGLAGGGVFHTTFTDVVPGQPIQVLGNVRSIDGRRTDVVALTANAVRRPDLSVVAINAPGEVAVDTSVEILATIAEINGSMGARGDCELLVDGTVVDFARGIWVDSGDTVACAFRQVFDAVVSPRQPGR